MTTMILFQQLPRFESNNRNLSINILLWSKDNGSIRKLKLSTLKNRTVINILLVGDHFVGVPHLNRLLNSRENRHNGYTYCERCLCPFSTLIKLKEHTPFCLRNDVIMEKMPLDKKFSFNKWGKVMSPSFVFYGDIECLLLPDGQHQPIMAAFLLLPHERILHQRQPEYYCFEGEDCIKLFLQAMEDKSVGCFKFNQDHLRTIMTPLSSDEQVSFDQSSVCYLCQKNFGIQKKCRDHDHLTGLYRGAACGQCNALLREQRSTFPVVFHNWRGYDSHHIVRVGSEAMKKWELGIIPTTREAYLNMRARVIISNTKEGNMKKDKRLVLNFIDSFQFLSSSLAALVSSCTTLPLTMNLPGSSEIKCGKGVFPYNYFDSAAKLTATELPPQVAFFNDLTQTPLSDDDYGLAQKAWKELDCSTMGDFMRGEELLKYLFLLYCPSL